MKVRARIFESCLFAWVCVHDKIYCSVLSELYDQEAWVTNAKKRGEN
jgi:hypothetical protein